MTIWTTVEFDAWARNMGYAEYLEFHDYTGCTSKPLCEKAYTLICRAAEAQFEKDNTFQ
jgi:hypothetical protein